MAVKVEYRIGIAAPVDEVYEIIADINNWPQWSPIHKHAEATLKFGGPFHVIEHYEGLGDWEVKGFLSDWSPMSHLHIGVPKRFWEGSLTRYFEMEELSKTGSSFAVGALFGGYFSEREGKLYRPHLRKGFEAMATALKSKVESVLIKS